MLTRDALKESINSAKAELDRAPVDGMLAYIIGVIETEHDVWNKQLVEVAAVAYVKAVNKNGGQG